MDRVQKLTWGEKHFLIHAAIMSNLRNWAASNNVPFVDIIKALDGSRNDLLSWVHLNSHANGIIAREFASEIARQTGLSTNERSRSSTPQNMQ